MIFTVSFTRKIWFVRLATRRLWTEVAAWRTKVSALKGWGLEWRVVGFRLTTPLVGTSIVVNWRGDESSTIQNWSDPLTGDAI